MNINRKKQSQFELFPGASQNNPESGRPAPLIKDLTLSLENIIVLCIIFVMASVLFFSFGVEKGKKAALIANNSNDPKIARNIDKSPKKQVVESRIEDSQEKRVVFPVDVPVELIEDQDSEITQPLELIDGQENLFTIQVASFKLQKNAQKEAEHLKGKGHDDAFVVSKGSYSIVCVGKFLLRDKAKKFSTRLKNKYNDCLVRRL